MCFISTPKEEPSPESSFEELPDLHDEDEEPKVKGSMILHVGGLFTGTEDDGDSDKFMERFNAAVEEAQHLEPISINEFISFMALHFKICEDIRKKDDDLNTNFNMFVSVVETLLPVGVRIQRTIRKYDKNHKHNMEYHERWKNLFIAGGKYNGNGTQTE